MARVMLLDEHVGRVDASIWAERDAECVCPVWLSAQERYTILSHLLPYAEWETRFAVPLERGMWQTMPSEMFQLFQDRLKDLVVKLTGGDAMGCNQALADAIREVASALRSSGGSGSNCYGSVVNCFGQYTDGQFLDTPPDAVDPHGEEPPPGFDTMEEYLLYKCQAAYVVLNWLIGFARGVSGWSALQLVLATAGPLVAVLMGGLGAAVVFPPAAIVALVAAVLVVGGLSAAGFWAGVILADYLTAHTEEITCALYESGSAGDALQALAGFVEDAFQTAEMLEFLGGMPEGMATALGVVFSSVQTNSLVAPLFQLTMDVAFPGADCSSCDGEPPSEEGWHFDEDTQGWFWDDLSAPPSEADGVWTAAPIANDPDDSSPGALHSIFDRDDADCFGTWAVEVDPPITIGEGQMFICDFYPSVASMACQLRVYYTDESSSQSPDWVTFSEFLTWQPFGLALDAGKHVNYIEVLVSTVVNGSAELFIDHVGFREPE